MWLKREMKRRMMSFEVGRLLGVSGLASAF